MSVYYTADLHLGHTNIITYCDRPFHSVGEMNAVIVANWNAVIGPDDIVHVLGDVAMGRREESMPLIGQLAGHKVLYPGNHDRCWNGHGARARKQETDYIAAGFEAIRHGPTTARIADHEVLLCHFPYDGDSHDPDRYKAYRPEDKGRWLLHGHVHQKWRQRKHMINVGVDVWDFEPVAQEALVAIMENE